MHTKVVEDEARPETLRTTKNGMHVRRGGGEKGRGRDKEASGLARRRFSSGSPSARSNGYGMTYLRAWILLDHRFWTERCAWMGRKELRLALMWLIVLNRGLRQGSIP